MRSTKENAFIVRSHSRILEHSSTRIYPPSPPPKNSSGAKLFRENDVIFIGHVLNLVLGQKALFSLPPERGCHVLCFYQESSFNLPHVLVCFLVQFDLLFAVWCAFLSNSGLCFLVYFICSRSQSPRLRDVNLGNSRI